jgi:hypothetical protein
VIKIGELGKAVPSSPIFVTLMTDAIFSDLFQTANGGSPRGSITTQHNTQIQISHKITPLETNKTKKNKSAHKTTQTVKGILQPMNTE